MVYQLVNCSPTHSCSHVTAGVIKRETGSISEDGIKPIRQRLMQESRSQLCGELETTGNAASLCGDVREYIVLIE